MYHIYHALICFQDGQLKNVTAAVASRGVANYILF